MEKIIEDDALKIIEQLKKRLEEFKSSNFYFSNIIFYRSLIPNIDIAIALTEKGIIDNRPIKKDEEYWFEGDRFIQDAFNLRDGTEYYEIYSKYISLVEFVRSENYFRKK